MTANKAFRWSPSCISATFFLLMSVWTPLTGAMGGFSTEGWTGLSFIHGKRFKHAESWVSLEDLNGRQCVCLCWLYRACTALTYIPRSRKCELHRLDSDLFSTVMDKDKVVVDIRRVGMDAKKRFLRGCDKRPCSEREMCAPVRNTASFVCLQLDSETCKTSTSPSVPNTVMTKTGVGSILYACVQGYFQTGNGLSTCDRGTKTWSAVDISCRFVDCGLPHPVKGAVSSGASTTADATVTYTCLSGAVPSSPGMMSTCQGISGQWSTVPGTCDVVSCGQPQPVDSMTYKLTARSDVGAFPGPTNDSLSVAFGGEAVYTCDEGYTVPSGPSSYISQCQADGTWSSTANFLCVPIDCGQPPTVDNSRPTNYTATTYNSSVKIECQAGFTPLGGVTLVCGADGKWQGPNVTCEKIKCGDPPRLHNANVAFNSTDVAAVAKYECVEPALKEGEDNSTAICMDNREWSAVDLVCVTVPCGLPPLVNHTSYFFIHNGLIFVQYTCDEGYIPGAAMTRVCSRTWSTNEVKCIGKPCGPAPHVSNATVTTTGLRYLDTATYTCNKGYVLNTSSAFMTCEVNGKWEPESPTCVPRTCDLSGLPKLSELIGDQQPTDASPTGSAFFNIGQPAYIPVIEDELSDLTTKNVTFEEGDEVYIKCAGWNFLYYTCGAPHVALDSARLKCVEGNWTVASFNNDVICVPGACALIPLLHGAVSELKGGDPIEAKYQCVPGLTVPNGLQVPPQAGMMENSTEFSIYCDENMGWHIPSGVKDGCTSIGCGEIVLPTELRLQAPDSYNVSMGTTVELSCRPPYYQNTTIVPVQNSVVCLGGAGWSLDNVTLTCALCNQDIAGIPNSVLEVNVSTHVDGVGDTANLTCPEDFVMPGGPRSVHCASVNGAPTWVGAEDATCLQYRWVKPVSVTQGEFIAPVYIEQLMTTGLEACVNLTYTEGRRLFVTLEEQGFVNSNDLVASRVFYYHDFGKESKQLKMGYSTKADRAVIWTSSLDIKLLTKGENAVLCLKMNLTDNSFKFSKNGDVLVGMEIAWYEGVRYFIVEHEREIHEINISYF